jgi:hypothetical protein
MPCSNHQSHILSIPTLLIDSNTEERLQHAIKEYIHNLETNVWTIADYYDIPMSSMSMSKRMRDTLTGKNTIPQVNMVEEECLIEWLTL